VFLIYSFGGELVSTGRVEQKEHAGVGYSASLKHCGSQKWQNKQYFRFSCLIERVNGVLSAAARAFKSLSIYVRVMWNFCS
jgi:hypothetical protein